MTDFSEWQRLFDRADAEMADAQEMALARLVLVIAGIGLVVMAAYLR